MIKNILKKLLLEFIAKKFGFSPKHKQKYYKPKKKKGLKGFLKKFLD